MPVPTESGTMHNPYDLYFDINITHAFLKIKHNNRVELHVTFLSKGRKNNVFQVRHQLTVRDLPGNRSIPRISPAFRLAQKTCPCSSTCGPIPAIPVGMSSLGCGIKIKNGSHKDCRCGNFYLYISITSQG